MSFPEKAEPTAMTPVIKLPVHQRRLLETLFVTGMLLLHLTLAVTSVRYKSNTVDEYIHLTAGYSYWTLNDYRLQPENGNLPQRWAALPLLFSPPAFPVQDPAPAERPDVWEIGHRFMYTLGNDADAILFKGRVMICLLSLALALVVFFWSRQIFGVPGAVITLILYTFSPTMLAHARLTTSDMASALFFVLALKLIWELLHRVSWSRIVLTALAVAGLLLSKMSGVLIVPMALLCLAIRLLRNTPLTLCLRAEKEIGGRVHISATLFGILAVTALISIVVVWGFYGFRFAASPHGQQGRALSFPTWEAEIKASGRIGPAIVFLRDRRILPEAYLFGFTYVVTHAQKRSAFLNGAYSATGWWYFFPFCYAVKTPLVSMLMLTLSLAAIVRCRDRGSLYRLVPLAVLIGIYWLVAMQSHINIGHRHILVTYPAFFIISGAVAFWLERYKKIGTAVFVASLSLYIAESGVVRPHYLAFFNAAVGGSSQGYRYLVDSSLDWGQDLPALQRWLQEYTLDVQNRRAPVYLSYFGTASPAYYKINARIILFRRFPWYREVGQEAVQLTPGLYCISATALQQVYGIRGWGRESEQLYWRLAGVNRNYLAARKTPDAWAAFVRRHGGFEQVARLVLKFREYQFARLCHHLKRRQPDHHVGHSILIYLVGPRELSAALETPWDRYGHAGKS
jgi:hypothetical protein